MILHDQFHSAIQGQISQPAHTVDEQPAFLAIRIGVSLGEVSGVDPDVQRIKSLGVLDDPADTLNLRFPDNWIQVIKPGVVGGEGDNPQAQPVGLPTKGGQFPGFSLLGDGALVTILHNDFSPVQPDGVKEIQGMGKGVLRSAHGMSGNLEHGGHLIPVRAVRRR